MKKKLILSLGSGGVRGYAHLGVFKSLFENQIELDAIYGCSIGSIVGSFIADGWGPDELIKLSLGLNPLELFDLKLNWNGVIGGQKLKAFMQKHISKQRVEQLSLPLTVVATNTSEFSATYFTAGPLPEIIQASCSIPRIFQPTKINGVEYLDGDLCSPVPILRARQDHGKEAVILAVDIVAKPSDFPRTHRKWAKWVEKDTYRHRLIGHESPHADIIINPDIGFGAYFDKDARKMRIRKGYEAMQAKIPELKRILVTV